ncbi:hypothetical protein Ancab_014511 [Ancistrocladus abbreviatus]
MISAIYKDKKDEDGRLYTNYSELRLSKSIKIGATILPIAKEEVRKSPVAPLDLEMMVERPPSVSGTVNGVGFKHKIAPQEHGIPSSMIKWKGREGISSSIVGE